MQVHSYLRSAVDGLVRIIAWTSVSAWPLVVWDAVRPPVGWSKPTTPTLVPSAWDEPGTGATMSQDPGCRIIIRPDEGARVHGMDMVHKVDDECFDGRLLIMEGRVSPGELIPPPTHTLKTNAPTSSPER